MTDLQKEFSFPVHDRAWLVLSDPVREPDVDLAQHHCHAFVATARRDLERLVHNLHDQGYRFATANPIGSPSPTDIASIRKIENRVGRLPVLARFWFHEFGRIDLSQDEEQRCARGRGVEGLGYGVLQLPSIRGCVELIEEGYQPDWVATRSDVFLPLGEVDDYDDYIGFALPSQAANPTVSERDGNRRTFRDFVVDYLAWGGLRMLAATIVRGAYSTPVRVTQPELLLSALLRGLELPRTKQHHHTHPLERERLRRALSD